ncbi:hypothetical protein ACPV5J_05275 [Vibrio rotiferianus]|uniref:hypothetical protein n=1 Tax=Vibrio rotiferianus TaxID=190895 RepID=UPI00406A610D
MIKAILPFALVAMTGCAAEKQVEADTQKALNAEDYRLFQVPGRGNVLPGIETEERAFAAKLCGVKIIQGISDIVRDDEELEKRKVLTQYAAEYNLKMYPKCKKAKQ